MEFLLVWTGFFFSPLLAEIRSVSITLHIWSQVTSPALLVSRILHIPNSYVLEWIHSREQTWKEQKGAFWCCSVLQAVEIPDPHQRRIIQLSKCTLTDMKRRTRQQWWGAEGGAADSIPSLFWNLANWNNFHCPNWPKTGKVSSNLMSDIEKKKKKVMCLFMLCM